MRNKNKEYVIIAKRNATKKGSMSTNKKVISYESHNSPFQLGSERSAAQSMEIGPFPSDAEAVVVQQKRSVDPVIKKVSMGECQKLLRN